MKLIKLINPEKVSEKEVDSYRIREAVRAVVVDDKEMIGMLYVSKKNYYKLPGGGVEDGESKINALKRECKEEIGCDVNIIKEVGIITEYRKIFHLKQISYCYLAKVKGKKGIPKFTDKENKEGFSVVWLTYERAIKILAESNASNIEGRDYIVPRDIAFLNSTNLTEI